jgi:hypothetical protein
LGIPVLFLLLKKRKFFSFQFRGHNLIKQGEKVMIIISVGNGNIDMVSGQRAFHRLHRLSQI